VSQLIGVVSGARAICPKDDRNACSWYRDDETEGAGAFGDFTYTTPWWPSRSLLPGSEGELFPLTGLRNNVWLASGSSSRFGIVGVTRDAYGSVLPSVTCKLFLTSTDVLLDQVISDANSGGYLLSTPFYPNDHYVVFYKVGTPDVCGTTVNTLIAG